MKPRLSEIFGILILGRHAVAIPYSGTSIALSNATAVTSQFQSLSTSPQITSTGVVEELVPRLGARTAVATSELELAPEATATLSALKLEPVLEKRSPATTFAIETYTTTTTATATFTTFPMGVGLLIPPGAVAPGPLAPHNHFWEIDNSPAPPPYVHGQLTPGSLGSGSPRPRVAVYCHEEYKFLYKWFNVTWIPAQGNGEVCRKLKKELQKEGMLLTRYRCREVGGKMSWQGGGARRMQATGTRQLSFSKSMDAAVWRAFNNYTVWYEGMDKRQLCQA